MRNAPTNSDDVIDSRDIIARIEELEGERDDFATTEAGEGEPEVMDWEAANPDDAAELAALTSLASEGEGCADWEHGETLIRDSYFTDYAMEMLQDIGDLPKDIPSYIVIDEDATARNIQQDYTAVDFDGVTYWIR